MLPETVENARYASGDGGGYDMRMLLVDLDGITCQIYEGWLPYFDSLGIVSLDGDGSQLKFIHILPAEPDPVNSSGRLQAEILRGHTADPRVVALVQKYLYDVRSDNWKPGVRID
jgi:hypothetical protein